MLADVDKVINRIISIIQKKNSDDSLGLKNVKYAEPDYEIYDDPPPYAFVKLARDYQSTENTIGRTDGAEAQQIIHLEIGVIGFGKNVATAQKIQLPITEAIKSALYGYRTLKNPETDDNPLSVRLNIERTSRLESKQGQEITGSLISLQIQIGTGNTISIGDIKELANIPVLGISGPDGKNYSEDTPGNERILTENNPNGSLSIEIEMTAAVLPKLKEIFDADDEILITINEGGITDTVTAYPVSIERVVKYDDINRRVLYFELV